jgi:hypothetical protein
MNDGRRCGHANNFAPVTAVDFEFIGPQKFSQRYDLRHVLHPHDIAQHNSCDAQSRFESQLSIVCVQANLGTVE